MKSSIEKEGFHYCFMFYDDFVDIKDPKFHELRKKYIEATKDLEDYIKNM